MSKWLTTTRTRSRASSRPRFKNTQFDSLQNFAFGIGSSYGIQAGTTTPTFATVGRQTFFKYNSTVSEGGQHLRLDPQAYYYSGPFCAYWEYAFSDEKFKFSRARTARPTSKTRVGTWTPRGF